MNRRIGQPVRNTLLTLWLLLLLGLSIHLLAVVLAPLVWDIEDDGREGQLVFFNSKIGGGLWGLPLEIGDYDGDGSVDLVVAPMAADAPPRPGPGGPVEREDSGEVYVLRGNRELRGDVDRAAFTDENFPGLTIRGARAHDFLGTELFTADFNGDGTHDLIVGSENYDGPRGERPTAGGAFVILGRSDLLADGSVIDLAFDPENPPDGVVTIFGERAGDRLGIWVEGGDLDGDGFDDLLMGADQSDGFTALDPEDPQFEEKDHRGMVVVLYGREKFDDAIIDLETGPEGTSFIYGRDPHDHFGCTLHSRDLDGDGRYELIASASLQRASAGKEDLEGGGGFAADPIGGGDGPDNGLEDAGEVTIIFSSADNAGRLPPRIDLSELSGPLPPDLAARIAVIHGGGEGESAGEELAVGDFQGDGAPELVIGAITATRPEPQPGVGREGATYVIYNPAALRGKMLDLATDVVPDGVTVSRMYGVEPLQIFGDTISVGDFNRDGRDDLAIGSPHVGGRAGLVHVIFGRPEPLPPRLDLPLVPDQPVPEDLLVAYVRGSDEKDLMSYSMEARDYDRDGYDDLFPNAMHGSGKNDRQNRAGEAYVISGFHLSAQRVTLDSVSPAQVALGEVVQVTLRGGGFTRAEDTRILVGGQEATEIDILSATEMTARFPARASARRVDVVLENQHGTDTLEGGFLYGEPISFIRGDSDGNGGLAITDPILTLRYLFLGDDAVCLDRHDTDDNGSVQITDPLRTLNFLFVGGPPPEPPWPDPGPDPTPDNLGCP